MLNEHERKALCNLSGQMREENLRRHSASLLKGINLFYDYIRSHFHMTDMEASQLLDAQRSLSTQVTEQYSHEIAEALKHTRESVRLGKPYLYLVKG